MIKKSGPDTIPRTFHPALITGPDHHRTSSVIDRSGTGKISNIPRCQMQNDWGFLIPGEFQWQ
jgi:hypothetical protein